MYKSKAFRTNDSALAYFVNQLENFDPKLHEPLVSISWSRDIALRPGITMSNESTSFIRSTFAGPGSLSANLGTNGGGNMPWASAEGTAIPGVSIDGQRVVSPLRLLNREVSYTSPELDRSQLLSQPIDMQKMDALNQLYQMNTDQMVYIGSSDVGATGLLNNSAVTVTNVPATGTGSSSLWINKTPNQILADVNTLVETTWEAAGYAVCPAKLLLPPAQFSYLASQLVSTAGSISILEFLKKNSIALSINGKELDIQPVKWLTGRGVSGADRMVAYTNDLNRVRFPMVPIRRETPYYQGIRFSAPYLWAFGEVEFVYPETVGYADGI